MSIKVFFNKIIYKYHTLAGIFVAIHLAILSFSGLMLLFKNEIQHINHHQTESIIDQNQFAVKFDQAHNYLLQSYSNDRPLDIYPDENNPQIIQARLGINDSNKVRGARIVNFDYKTGQEIQVDQLPASEFYNWLLTLHQQLFMGQRGQIYIGIVGIAFILMNMTGLMLFIKRRRKKLHKQIYSTQSEKAKFKYLHQYLGVICLCWGLIVGTTGALLALNPIFTKHFQENTLKHLAEKYQNQRETKKPDVSLKSVINTAFNTKPDGVIWYIIFPGMERGIKDHYLILMHGNGLFSQYINEYLVVSANSAEVKEIIQLPILMQLALIATPFHFVNYGGVLLKVFWAMFAVCTLGIAFLGITIFYQKKKLTYAKQN